MFRQGIQFLGDSFEATKITVKNVTNADTVAGGVYALDLTAADSDTSGAADPVRAALGNIKAVATANLTGILVITPKIIKAGEVGNAIIGGPAKCLVNGTTDIAKGDRLKAQNGSAVLVKAIAGSSDIGFAVALEVFTTNADGTIWVLCDGVCFNKAANDQTTVLTNLVADPGNAGAIAVTTSGHVELVSGGAETRTLAAPTFIGQQLLLSFKTDGGDCVVTCATTINQTGNNTITLNDAGDAVMLVAKANGNNIRWAVAFNDGATLATV